MRKHTFHQILSSVTACLTNLHMGLWRGYLSVIIPRFRKGNGPIHMNSDNISWMVALVDVGALFSLILAGYLMDRFGRVVTLRLSFISLVLAMPLLLGATAPYHMNMASLLVGFGFGIGYTTPVLYIAEIAKPKIRGSLGSIAGVLLTGGLAVTMTFGPFLSYECLTWAILVCPLAGFFLTFFIVESPFYHFIQNNETGAAETLSQVRNKAKMNEKDVELESIRKRVDEDLTDSGNFLELVSQNRRALTIVFVLGMLQPAGGNSCLTMYGSTTLPKDPPWDPKISMMIFAWLYVIFSILGMSLVDRFGRKPLMIISSGGVFLVTAVSAVFYYFQKRDSVSVSSFVFVPHIGILLYAIFSPIGVALVPNLHRGELLSVKIKGPASAVVSIVASVIFFIYNKVYFAVDESIGVYFMYVIFSIASFIGLIFTITCVFETKGKTLEEIQTILNK